MAYLIKYGTRTIYEPGSDSSIAHNAKITQTSDGIAQLTFTIPPGNPLFNIISVHDTANPVYVYYNDTELFRGIITSITNTFNLEREVVCKSELIWLDWVFTRFKPSDTRPGTALAELLGIQNNHVDLWNGGSSFYFAVDPASRADYVGYLDPDTNENACNAETSTPMSILAIINKKIIEPYGAYLRLSYDTQFGTRYVGIYDTPPESSGQTVTIGENLLDYNYTESDDELYTACYPMGGTLDDEITAPAEKYLKVSETTPSGATSLNLVAYTSGTTVNLVKGDILIIDHWSFTVQTSGTTTIGDTPVRVGISTPTAWPISANKAVRCVGKNAEYYDKTTTLLRLNSGHVGDYYYNDGIVYNRTAARKYGIKCMTFMDADIKDPTQLLYRAMAALAPHIEPTRSLSVKALDMAFYSDSYNHLKVGQTVRVVSTPHNIDTTMYVRECSVDLDDPANTRYTLGTAAPAITRAVADSQKRVVDLGDNMITELNDTIIDTYIRGLS